MPLELSGSIVISGSMTVSGSIGYTGSLQSTGDSITDVTGSLFGTSSWAQNTVTASYILSSGVYGPQGMNSVLSASHAVFSVYATSASWAPCTCDTGAFAITGSNTFRGNQTISGSLSVTGNSDFQSDLAVTGTLAVGFNIVVPTVINIDPTPLTGSMYVKPSANELWIYTGNSATGWVTASLGI